MNIISNNCLGGFIYRDILKEEYKNPFIWTRMEISQFIDFIDNFKNINFNNVIIDKNGDELSNNFITVIDNKYTFKNRHIMFSEKDDKPRITRYAWVNVYYKKPWEYILEKYKKRINRMDNNIRVFFYDDDPNSNIEKLNMIADVCAKHRYKCMIFTEKNVIIENDFVKVLYFKNKEPWKDDLFEKYKNTIEDFLK